MICLLHGYLLEGSGSNLWTRSVIQALCRTGETIHLVCQENHPERYDFIAESHTYHPDGSVETTLQREVPYDGRCIMHKPKLGEILPVYVWDKYEEFSRVVPMVSLPDEEIESYIKRNIDVVRRVVRENGITVMQANHMVLMSVVAQRVGAELGVPFVIMPHGSALEYAVKADTRFKNYARTALVDAKRLLVSSHELGERVFAVFDDMPELRAKLGEVRVGVDTSGFHPVPREERAHNIEHVVELLGQIKRSDDPDAKLPDWDAAERLQSIDWMNSKTVIFVGRLIAEKGAQCLVAAWPEILRATPNARLIIAGHGPMRAELEDLIVALREGKRQRAYDIARDRMDGVVEYWSELQRQDRINEYFDELAPMLQEDTIQFIGYLTHRELSWLFSCFDVGVFPSMVKESGPMVFLEALSCGCFPIATYFAGAKDKIDTVAPHLKPADAELMKVRPEPDYLAADLARVVPGALAVSPEYPQALRLIAQEEYDWKPIAAKLAQTLKSL